jgi:hypothetical protein
MFALSLTGLVLYICFVIHWAGALHLPCHSLSWRSIFALSLTGFELYICFVTY